MAFIYTNPEDGQVVGVFEVAQQSNEGNNLYEEAWSMEYGAWWRYKIIRNGVGDYYNTNELHPDDNDNLMKGDL